MLKGIEIPLEKFSVRESIIINDLIYYDGPILSHIQDPDGYNYLIQWVDRTKDFDRWLLFDVSEKDLFRFVSHKVDLKKILEGNKYVYLVDTDQSETLYKKILLIRIKELPEDYSLQKDYFFKLPIPGNLEYLIDKYSEERNKVSSNFISLRETVLEETLINYVEKFSQRGAIFSFQM